MRFTQWGQMVSTEESNEAIKPLALCLASRIASPAHRKYLTDSITSGDFHSLCNADTPYSELTVFESIQYRQVLALYSKREDLDIGIDKLESGRVKFMQAELLCADTNDILQMKRCGKFSYLPHVESVLFTAQRKIASILGDVPSLSNLKCRFGPGATTQVQKRTASARRKLGQTFACSEELLPIISDVLEELQGWLPDGESDTVDVPVEIHTGRVSFVPKNSKTTRAVVVEPMLNTMFQLGIGDHIARRLLRSGVDLSDQTRNQRLALEGSLTGALATLDLSSASDTIAYELVFDLLPVDWALFLAQFRTGTVEIEGRQLRQQKFSSMGNGFTFPLESLIFYALAFASTPEDQRGDVSVYGDDIIVPVGAYGLLTEVLNACGFIPNLEKSFASGPFRESCGADYLSGIDIRPVYLKTRLAGFDVFRLHNFFVRSGDFELASILLELLDPSLLRFGPDGYGDGHLLGDYRRVPCGRGRGWSGHTFETYTFRPRRDFTVSPGDRVYPSYCSYLLPEGSPLVPLWSREDLRSTALRCKSFSGSTPHYVGKDGSLGVTIPGRQSYSLIKIYVLV